MIDKSFVLSPAQMYLADKLASQECGIPPKTLMEKAGSGCAEYIQRRFKPCKSAIVCGSGNNGGDGFVIARKLKESGFEVEIFFVGKRHKFSPETKENFDKCQKMNIPIFNFPTTLDGFFIVVDCLFGIGFKGKVRAKYENLFHQINNSRSKVFSIDIPSGLDAKNGESELCIKADFTLTLAAYKLGHFLGGGKRFCGTLELIDIGIPKQVFDTICNKATLGNIDLTTLPKRFPTAHKGNYGKVAIVAGSKKYSGAATLCSSACLHAGAGLIYLYYPDKSELFFTRVPPEIIKIPIDENPQNLDLDFFEKDILLIGPGFDKKRISLFEELVSTWKKPLIVDADGLNLLSENRDLLEKLKGNNVLLTPHLGEFSRLCMVSIEKILEDTIGILKAFCKNYKINVLLKSSVSVFCNTDKIVLLSRGNDGLATGGSGDVLAGIIASFAAQGLPLDKAAIGGSLLLGKTAEKLAKKFKTPAITPSRIIKNLFKK